MMYVYMYLGGALPVNSSVGIDRGEVGRGLAVARVNMPLRTGRGGRQGREVENIACVHFVTVYTYRPTGRESVR